MMDIEIPCDLVLSTGVAEPATIAFLDGGTAHVYVAGVVRSKYMGERIKLMRKNGTMIGTFEVMAIGTDFQRNRTQFVCLPVSANPAR